MTHRDKAQAKVRVFLSKHFLVATAIIALVLSTVIILAKWEARQTWPLLVAAVGLSGIYTGLVRRRRFAAGYMVPSLIFIVMAGVFSLFSFGLIPMTFVEFVVRNWHVLILIGALCILAAWIWSIRRKARKNALKAAQAAAAAAAEAAEAGKADTAAAETAAVAGAAGAGAEAGAAKKAGAAVNDEAPGKAKAPKKAKATPKADTEKADTAAKADAPAKAGTPKRASGKGRKASADDTKGEAR